jgi:hypothetical protein
MPITIVANRPLLEVLNDFQSAGRSCARAAFVCRVLHALLHAGRVASFSCHMSQCRMQPIVRLSVVGVGGDSCTC